LASKIVHFIFIGVGLFYLLMPKAAWRLEIIRGGRKNEPPKYALIINRVLGGILILIGLYRIIYG